MLRVFRALSPASIHLPAMTPTEREALLDRLAIDAGDWAARLALVEAAVGEGDLAGAKRLVRASPSDRPTPSEIQVKLHTLLTGGVPAAPPPATAPRILEPVPAEKPGANGAAPIRPATGPDRPGSKADAGGLGALVENEFSSGRSRPTTIPADSRAGGERDPATPPPLRRTAGKDKWKDYDGGLELVDLPPIERIARPSSKPDRYSSVSLALVAHLAALLLLSLVVVSVQQPQPPQLVVSVIHEREADLVTTRLTRPSPDPQPSAASAQAVDVVTAISTSSTFQIPDVETPNESVVSATLPGVAPAGMGMSLTGRAVDSSDVNFFGLSGSGRRIVFIIDATPEMLVDEKGGMSAYDKVKDEVGIMLANLNRGTRFNLLLFQGKELVSFRPDLVPGLPSNLRQAIEWLDPLNRDYEALGLRGEFGPPLEVTGSEGLPIAAGDVAHHVKAVQKALEWQASAIFCITAGYRAMNRAPTPEMLAKLASLPPDRGEVDPAEQAAWRGAVARTREWLAAENAARRGKGLDPKVVVDFNRLVREVTGASPPRRRGNVGGAARPSMPRVTPEEIERQVDLLVKREFKARGHDEPSLHLVLFLGEEEEIDDAEEDHFRTLTRRNRGKLKVLRGLAALEDVTRAK